MARYTEREPLGVWGTVLAGMLGVLLAAGVMTFAALSFVAEVLNGGASAANIDRLNLGDPPPPMQRPERRSSSPPERSVPVRPLAPGERCVGGVRFQRDG